MKAGLKPYLIAASLAVLSLSGFAQEHPAHATSATSATTVSRPPAGKLGAGRVATSSATPTPAKPSAIPRYRRGLYGASILLPYDSESDQLEGHGTLDHQQAAEEPERRVGTTIFEHNGVAGSLDAAIVRHPASSFAGVSSLEPAGPSMVLVFRDGHQQEVENYAIAGSKLIVVGDKTESIAMADLDLDATAKANRERGLDFKMPKSS